MTSSSTRWLSSSIATEDAGHRLAIEEAITSGENNLILLEHSPVDAFDETEPLAAAAVESWELTGAGISIEGGPGTATWDTSLDLIVIRHNGQFRIRVLLAMPLMQTEQKI
jgi:hypothetical protein